MKPAEGSVSRTARWLAGLAFCVYAATGGGRIAGSDEVTMFQLSRALLRGGIEVPQGATLAAADGRVYSKNAAAQAVLALPLVAASEAASGLAGLGPEKRELAARFGTSFFNALVAAALVGVFYAACRALGAGSGAAFAATLLLAFTTPVWVYAKSFMAEPLESLGLLLALSGAARAAGGDERGARTAALGAFLAVSAKLVMLPLALACLAPLAFRRHDGRAIPGRAWVAAALAAALAGHLAYNVARFGTPFETGYGAQASTSAYSTPLWVGLYGLLLSSGKGIAWFAPALALAFRGVARLRRAAGGERSPLAFAARRLALGIAAAWAVALLLYGGFEHWAGDGSFGPRYLLPVVPLAFLAVAFGLEGASRVRRRVAWALGLLGLAVQVGGVFIYFGMQMRDAGDYPYTRSLSDPRFMSDSHFNPRFAPILQHWRLLARNAGEHLAGRGPRLTGEGERDPRLGIAAADEGELLHALDVWWLYARYVAVPAPLVYGPLALLLAAAALAARRAALARRAEAG